MLVNPSRWTWLALLPSLLCGCDDSRPVSETMTVEDTALDGDATTDDTTPAPDGDDTDDTDTTGDGDALDAADTSSGDTSAVDVDAPSDLGDTRDPDGDEDTAVADVDDTTDTTDTTPPACLALGVPCTVGDTCCDDAVCDVQSGVCRNACLEVGATCEFDGDCCTGACDSTMRCCSNCPECQGFGDFCESHDDCCPALFCLEGMCQSSGTP